MTELTLERLAEMKVLEREATVGPWRAGSVERESVFGDVGNPSLMAPYVGRNVLRTNQHFEQYAADAQLIAAMRNELPALLAAARRLLESEAAEVYLIDSGLLGRGLVQWAKEAGWPGIESGKGGDDV